MKTLRELRFEKGETLEQVAKALGVGPGVVSAWELGRQFPWPRHIPAIAEHFGITPQQARECLEESKRQADAAAASR